MNIRTNSKPASSNLPPVQMDDIKDMSANDRETYWRDREQRSAAIKKQIAVGLKPTLSASEQSLQHYQSRLRDYKREGRNTSSIADKIAELRQQVEAERQAAERRGTVEYRSAMSVFEDSVAKVSGRGATPSQLASLTVAKELFDRGGSDSEQLFAAASEVMHNLNQRDSERAAEIESTADLADLENLKQQKAVADQRVEAAQLRAGTVSESTESD